MMRGLFLIALFFVLGCSSVQKADVPVTAFSQISAEFVADFEKINPSFAVAVGDHRYDSQLTIYDDNHREQFKYFLENYKKKIQSFDVAQLNASDLMDSYLLLNFIDGSLWEMQELKNWQWDASQYNLGSSIAGVIEGAEKSNSEKALAVAQKMQLFPRYYSVALQNLKNPTDEHLTLALQQNKGFLNYLKTDVKGFAQHLSGDSAQMFEKNFATAVDSTEKFVQALGDMQKNKSLVKRSFRLGEKLYAEKFKYDLVSSYTAKEVYEKAIKAKKETHKEMKMRSEILWPKYFPGQKRPKDSLVMIKQLISKIGENHVKANEFVPTIQKQVPALWDFVVQKDLMTLDPGKKLKVRETPIYQRGFAGASVDAPGPFDDSRETYYNVTPLDDMKPEQQESYLREYNNYTLQILNIHEAIPGHYVQLIYGLQSPSLIKKIFGNGTMVEGWAVYSERMMLEQGYGNFSPEMWLMYYKWRLRVISNTILDYSVHNLNMSKKQALDLMVKEAFQEQEEAEKKWARATYSQVQLVSYFAGFTEIYEFREELKKTMGERFNLKKFHEKFLSYGSSPVKYIKQEMRKEFK